MKRAASQTFCTHVEPATFPGLAPLQEGLTTRDYAPSHVSHASHSTTSSISRTLSFKNGYKQIRRRLSNSSGSSATSSSTSVVSRRPSLSSLLNTDSPAITRRSSMEPVARLQHHDSGMPTPTLNDNGAVAEVPHSRFSLRRLGSTRLRRPATSGPSGEYARYNPVPPPVPTNYPMAQPGQAARAAAAANNERLQVLKREAQEQQETSAFLNGHMAYDYDMEDILKDSESGVGMQCSSPIQEEEAVPEKKLGKCIDVASAARVQNHINMC